MAHEHAPVTPSPERHEEREETKSVFNLDGVEPRQIAGLYRAFAVAKHSADPISPEYDMYSELDTQLDHELLALARTSDNALDVYSELVAGERADEQTQNAAVEMVPDLLRRSLDNPEAKKQIVDPLVTMVQGGGLAHDAAEATIDKLVVYGDWLDEPTKRYLDQYLLDPYFD